MKENLKVLVVDDSDDDAVLIVNEIKRSAYSVEWNRVEMLSEFEEALKKEWDVIILDYSLPSFSGLESLKILREKKLETPRIMLSGKMGEEAAVEAMKAGAHDYILKTNLSRLVPAIQRSIGEFAVKKEKKQAEENFQMLFNHILDSVYVYDIKGDKPGNIKEANDYICKKLEYSRDELLEKTIFDLTPSDQWEAVKQNIKQLISTGKGTYESSFVSKSGRFFYMEIKSAVFKYGDTIRVLESARNITDRKKAEKKLKDSLTEKELLLKEIHHRVKNNLNIIYCLIKLQQDYIKDDVIYGYFEEISNRISSMGIIHELLYRNNNFARINFLEYLSRISEELVKSHSAGNKKIELKINSDEINFNIDLAIPLGLIVTELITNTMKHAFPGDRNGLIKISFSLDEEEMVTFKYSDDGVGLPENISFPSNASFGLQIISALTAQIGAEVSIDRKCGTSYMMKFRGE